MRTRTLALFPLLALAATPRAQDAAPSVQELAGQAHELVQRLVQMGKIDAPNDEQQAALADTRKALEQFVARIEKLDGLTVEHYVEAGSPMLEEFAAECLRITDAGLKRFPDARFLWDHAGFAHTQLAIGLPPCTQRITELKAAEIAFINALPRQPDTFHAHMGLYQVLSLLDRCDEALQQLEIVAKDEQGKAQIPDLWRHRVSLLLRAGKTKDALAVLAGPEVPEAERADAAVLELRAHALAGNATAAQAAIKAMREKDQGPRSLVEAADALGYLGKKQEALKLLAQRPPLGTWETEEERVAQLLLQTAAAQEVMLNATDFTPKGPLRGALTKALGHTYKAVDPTAKPPKETDLSGSPTLIAQMLAGKPRSPQKDWGNRLLIMLCMRAVRDHKPSPLETQVLALTKDRRVPTADDLPALYLATRYDVGDADACGVLTGLRAQEKMFEKKAAPAPAKK